MQIPKHPLKLLNEKLHEGAQTGKKHKPPNPEISTGALGIHTWLQTFMLILGTCKSQQLLFLELTSSLFWDLCLFLLFPSP